ncbi:MAG: 2-amino-4-hydroxy-6-hydroxymethyldihydropteridine diphosphokinase [Sulfuritalea sp.]|nr:2-amino-4-hydroxy-6-hydroxymethyldihydropteridine diphosphokinase [Sulfuritalea sp.]
MSTLIGTHRSYIGIGSNLGDPVAQVLSALEELAGIRGVRMRKCSSLYRTAPVGYAAQPDFINAVAEIRTSLAPLALLDALQRIESHHGRIREFRNSPRTLDLDILLYGDLRLAGDDLVLPHPRAHERAFVLRPLQEIAPRCVIPGVGPIRDWVGGCLDQPTTRLALDRSGPLREPMTIEFGYVQG